MAKRACQLRSFLDSTVLDKAIGDAIFQDVSIMVRQEFQKSAVDNALLHRMYTDKACLSIRFSDEDWTQLLEAKNPASQFIREPIELSFRVARKIIDGQSINALRVARFRAGAMIQKGPRYAERAA